MAFNIIPKREVAPLPYVAQPYNSNINLEPDYALQKTYTVYNTAIAATKTGFVQEFDGDVIKRAEQR
jgi:hypothetical protein